jgi:subtilisin family serine protease
LLPELLLFHPQEMVLISSRFPSVICVGATNRNYGRPDWTNYGLNLTIWAPGDTINSSTINVDFPYLPISGTSQASPHIAGVVANFIAFENLQSDVATVLSRLDENGQSGVLSKFMGAGSPDLLANYGLANPNRNPQFPYAGPQKELVKDVNQDPTANSFVLDNSGATATITSTPFLVMNPPSATTNVNFEGALPSNEPDIGSSVSSQFASIASGLASVFSKISPLPAMTSTTPGDVSSTQFALEPSNCPEPCTQTL